jgi:hypothetical protein
VIAGLLGVLFGLHRIVDPDVFLHVVVGKAILKNPMSLGISTFIERYPRYPYVEDKWLASVAVSIADALGGEHGLMAYQILLCVGFAVAFYYMLRAWNASSVASILGVACALLACSFRLEPRPDTISHALLAVVIALTVAETPFRRLRWVVPLLLAGWVNLHGYFVNGLLVLFAAGLCRVLGDRTRSTLHPAANELTAGQWFALLALALGACFLHPQGWKALANPVQQILALAGDSTFKTAIQEFSSSSELLEGMTVAHILLVVATLLSIGVLQTTSRGRSPTLRQGAALGAALPWLVWPPSGLAAIPYRMTAALYVMALFEVPEMVRRRCYLGPVLLGGFTVLAAPLIRNLPLLPTAALILVAPAWGEALDTITLGRSRRVWALTYATAILTVVLPIAWLRLSDRLNVGVRAPTRTGWGVDHDRFPVAAIDFIERERLPGPLLNNFDVGSYLLYRLYPRRRAFIAGSTYMYPPAFMEDYQRILYREPLDDIRRRYGTATVVIELASPATQDLLGRLASSPEWSLVFLDRAGAVFLHVNEDTRQFAERHTVDLDARVRELADTEHTRPAIPVWLGGKQLPFPAFNVGMFMFAVGRPDLTLIEAMRLWSDAPTEDLAVVEAEAARRSQRIAEELPRIEQALRTYPDSKDLKTFVTLGLAFRADERLRRGAIGDAELDLGRMIALAPDACGPYSALAKAAALRGDISRARDLVRESMQRDGDGTCRRALEMDPQLSALL